MFELASKNKGATNVSSSVLTKSFLQKKTEPSDANSLSSIISNRSSFRGIQTKLTVNKPNDKYEKEADKVADQVTSHPVETVQSKIQLKTEKEEETQSKSESEKEEEQVQKKGESEKEEELVQRKGESDKQEKKVQKKEEEKKKEPVQKKGESDREEEPVQKKSESEEKEEPVQRKADSSKKKNKKKEGIKYVKNIDQPEEKPKEEVQAKLQLKSNESASKSNSTFSTFESSLNSSKGGGSPLPKETRTYMENKMGADFSGVRVHSDTRAVQMSSQISAQAFTHGSNIYFNSGKYNPGTSAGKNLLAHELTHTVQQGASVQRKSTRTKIQKKSASSSERSAIQRSWLGDAWDVVSGAVSSAVEVVSEGLEAGLNWIKEKFTNFVKSIPGYKLLSVVLGQDPITNEAVARNGMNFIEAGLDIIPFGNLFKKKLEETGALAEAAAWLDNQIAGLDISLGAIKADISAFWNSLSLSDIGHPTDVLERAANIIRRPIGQIITFAANVATEFLRIVKNYVLSELVLFIKNHTRGYPLLTVILGKDPITEEPVERNGMNLIRGFMMLSADGEEQLRQMQETGSLQKAADWIDTTVAELDLSWETIRTLFSNAWNLLTIENLMKPLETFQQLVELFAEPVGRIIRFVIKVGLKILEFIKITLLARLSKFARETRGYPLVTVILGKDPFTSEPVPRNAENIIHGFMSLMEGGEEQFQQMKQTGAIKRTTEWIEGAIARLGFTWAYITGLFKQAWESFSLQDLAAPLQAFARIVKLFAPPILRLIEFVWEVLKKVIEIILIIMHFPFDLVNNIITKSMQAINDIKRDPIGFLKNILRAIKLGFENFFSNILKHLLFGLTGWLFGELQDAGINPPKDFTFKSVLGFVLEVLGITMDRIWKKLAEKIGQDKVDKIRGMLDKLEGIWKFIKDVATRGPIAIWEYIVEKLSDLWNTVLESVRNWVMTKIIEQVTVKLLSMLDPTGIMAVVNSCIAIYKAIESFIRYIKKMLEIINSFVNGVAEIAKGNIKQAADFIENAMHRSMPVVIGFLANQVGLGGVGRKIGEIIEKVREKVDNAIGWLIDKALSIGKAFLDMLKRGVTAVGGKIASWLGLKKSFTASDGSTHTISAKGEKNPELVIQSESHSLLWFAKALNNPSSVPATVRTKINAISDRKDRAEKITKLNDWFIETVNSNAEKSPDEKIFEKLTEVKNLIPAELLSESEANLPLTNVSWETEDSKASKVTANPLSKRAGNTIGNSSTDIQIEGDQYTQNLPSTEVTSKRRGITYTIQSDYVKAHLLHDGLHGPSAKWNLAYAKRTINENMKKNEKYAIERPDDVFSYETEVDYFKKTGDQEWKNAFAQSFTVNIKYLTKDDNENWVEDKSRTVPSFGPWTAVEPPDADAKTTLPRIPTDVEDAYKVADEMNKSGIGWTEIARQFNANPNVAKLQSTKWLKQTISKSVTRRRDNGIF